ncbi:hypothetical protein M9Y10_030008 [Tritrichomonas musculus]|uniref:Cyclophilin-like domain-containing protein n=1 Tax=Tritrichomonas musculus TaxID=1915356 RepID=A0ABR2KPC5_9EUKA
MILSNVMLLTIGSTVLKSILVNNTSTDALKELLNQKPLTIEMNDYGNFEKVGPIGTTLPRNDVRITTEPGDIILYLGSNLCLYYNTNTYTFTRIGKIQDVTQDDLKKILGDGSVTVTFSLEKKDEQSSDFQSDQSSSIQSDESSNIQSDQSSSIQSDESSSIQSDESSDFQSDQSSSLQSDESSNLQSDQSSSLQSDQSSDFKSDLSYDQSFDKSPNYPLDQSNDDQSDQTSEHYSNELSTRTPLSPPTKPPMKTEEVDINEFDVDGDKVTIDMSKDSFKEDVIYDVHVPEQIKNVELDSNSNKKISLILSEQMKEISIHSLTESSNQQVEIVPKSDEITITLDEQTRPSIAKAKGRITLESNKNEKIYLNQISPQSKNFILIPNVPVKIDEIDFSGENAMNIQTNNNNINVEIEKIKVQPHSVGTINNAAIKSVVLGPLSSMNFVGNVDISDSIIDLPYNEELFNTAANALISGDLKSIPKSIFFNARGFVYLDGIDRILIAESESSGFNCDEWANSFRKGPFNSKFNDAKCENLNDNNKNMKRLYAFVNDNKQDDKGKRLNGGAIAGIVVGIVVVIAIVVILIYFFVIKKKKDKESSEHEID